MTKEQMIDAYARRLNGESLQSIADRYGVTREYIRQITVGAGPSRVDKCVFPNLQKWMAVNDCKLYDLADRVGASYNSMSRWMTGQTDPKLYYIERILEVTGMSFEEAFARKGGAHANH